MGWMLPESALCHSSWCGAFLCADTGLGTMQFRQPETPLIARIVITAATPAVVGWLPKSPMILGVVQLRTQMC
jgi:hypothetical protein